MKRPNLARLWMLPILLFCLLSSLTFAGEAQWVEVRSPNFRVYTDAGEKRGRETALRFEQMRFAFGEIFKKAKVQTGVPVRVIAFRNSKEFRTVAPVWKGKARENVAGYYLPGDSVAFIALDLSAFNPWTVVFHEYAHLLLNANVTSTPVWFDEGFAEYYSTIKIEKNQWVLGAPPEYAPRLLHEAKFIPLADLFAARHDSPMYNEGDHVSIFYAESWLALEYFFFDNLERQRQLLQYLNISQQMPVPEAMKRAFGKDPAMLDKEFQQYFRSGQGRTLTFDAPPALEAMQMKATPLDDPDARATIAELRLNERDYFEQAKTELEDILKQKPDQPIAVRGLGYAAMRDGKFEKAAEYFDRAMAIGSDDPRVYLYWAMAVRREGSGDSEMMEKQRKALEKCIALDPEISEAYSLLAFTLVRSDFDAAIASMKKAIALNPRGSENYLNLAGLYMTRGKYDEAEAALQQVLHDSDGRLNTQAQHMLAQIAQMKQSRTSYTYSSKTVQSTEEVSGTNAVQDDADLKSFAGTLVSIQCHTSTNITLTVNTGKEKLVLKGNTDEMMFSGKDLSCDLKNVKVHGHYNANNSEVVTLVVE